MSVRFDATTDYLRRTTGFSVSGASQSGCLWIKRKVDTGTFATAFYVRVITGSQLELFIETEGGGDVLHFYELPGTESDITGPTLTVDTWFFIGWRRTNTARKLYWGTEAGGTLTTATNADSRTVTNAPGEIYIANDIYNENFNGEVAYVRYWTTDLTDEEMDAEWRSTTPVKTASLYGDWRLASAATATTDSSGNSNTLTTGGTLADGGADPTPPVLGGSTIDTLVYAKAGAFSIGTGAAASTVAITDAGFQPKCGLFWWSGQTSTTDARGRLDHIRGFGAAVSTSDRRCVVTQSDDTPTNMATDCAHRDDAFMASLDIAGAVTGLADFQSWDSGGATFVIDDQFPASYRTSYLLLGGPGLTHVKTGAFQEPGATGDQDITGLGFQPDGVIFFSVFLTTAPASLGVDSIMMMGAADAGGNQAVWTGGSNDAAGTSQTMAYCRSGECIALFNAAVGAINAQATYVSAIPDGFRLNWSVRNTTRYIHYIAFKGPAIRVGNLLTLASASTIAVSGVGFRPRGGLFVSATAAENASATPTDNDEWSCGAFSSASAQTAQGVMDDDAAGTAVVAAAVEHDAVYVNMSLTGTLDGVMAVQTVNADGLTMVMADADPAQAHVFYMLFGDPHFPPLMRVRQNTLLRR